MYDDELYHFNIKNSKWGVRRWQNPDGSYNAEGKERYNEMRRQRRAELSNEAKDVVKKAASEAKDVVKKVASEAASTVVKAIKEERANRKARAADMGVPSRKLTPKMVKRMTLTELQARQERLEAEKKLLDLYSSVSNKGKKPKEHTIKNKIVKPVVTELGKKAFEAMLYKSVNAALGTNFTTNNSGNNNNKNKK